VIALRDRADGRCPHEPTSGIDKEDVMNVYTAQHLSKAHHTQHLANADHSRLVKQAHLASGAKPVFARRPVGWLREAAGHFASRLMARTSAHAGSH